LSCVHFPPVRLQKNGVSVPHTTAAPEKALSELRFPLIRKPRFGSASVGVSIIQHAAERLPDKEDSTEYIYQELIAGQEVNIELCGDLNGRVMSVNA
jgi:carbamoyl-phosphate synthase large subunit